jgi:pimeloyl-ACP methyl ester carboxylesterase
VAQYPNEEIRATVMDLGQGRPITFLHGLVGLNDHWEGVVERISHRNRCVLFEIPLLQLRGEDRSITGATRMTVEFLRTYLRQPSILVGNSFGGHVALKIALEYPELVSGLVLAGSSGLLERTMVKEITVRPSREWLVRKIGELFYDKSLMREADIDRAHRELSDRGGARAMIRLSRSARSDHLGDKIHNIKHPTLLIWGKQDVVTPPEAAREFTEKLQDSRIVWLDRCGHAPMIECPELFAEALQAFSLELDARAAQSAKTT